MVVATGQSEAQNPQLPWPPTWSSLEFVSVEHQGSVSPGRLPSNVHSLWSTPSNLKGKTQDWPESGPLTVLQLEGAEVVDRGGIVVGGGVDSVVEGAEVVDRGGIVVGGEVDSVVVAEILESSASVAISGSFMWIFRSFGMWIWMSNGSGRMELSSSLRRRTDTKSSVRRKLLIYNRSSVLYIRSWIWNYRHA